MWRRLSLASHLHSFPFTFHIRRFRLILPSCCLIFASRWLKFHDIPPSSPMALKEFAGLTLVASQIIFILGLVCFIVKFTLFIYSLLVTVSIKMSVIFSNLFFQIMYLGAQVRTNCTILLYNLTPMFLSLKIINFSTSKSFVTPNKFFSKDRYLLYFPKDEFYVIYLFFIEFMREFFIFSF